MKLVSACLLGIRCRYDGSGRPDKKAIELFRKGGLVPVCPEQLGGLPTPREPAEIRGDKVFTESGRDVTENFIRGAEETLRLAKLLGIKEAVLKSKSSACGCGKIHDGTFSGALKDGDGVTAALLKRSGIRVVTEEEL
jgi:uncharacterized protein YbbK (DUF523 family)